MRSTRLIRALLFLYLIMPVCQLDGVSASIRALPEVLAAVDGRAEVLMDGRDRRVVTWSKLCVFEQGLSSAGVLTPID
jgi:hypothetical protein